MLVVHGSGTGCGCAGKRILLVRCVVFRRDMSGDRRILGAKNPPETPKGQLIPPWEFGIMQFICGKHGEEAGIGERAQPDRMTKRQDL